MAWAPKLMRRANCVLGELRDPLPAGASSSSMAFSSKAVSEVDELVDMLARRAANDDAPMPPLLGPALALPLPAVAPDRPSAAVVETDRRRRRFWSMAAEVMGPGKAGVPLLALEVELLRKMLERVAEVTELRRLRDILSVELGG